MAGVVDFVLALQFGVVDSIEEGHLYIRGALVHRCTIK